MWSFDPSAAGTHRFDNWSITLLGGGQRSVKVLAKAAARPFHAPTPPPADQIWRSYYFANGRPVAMRVVGDQGASNVLYVLHQDHLGSTSLVTSITGTVVSQQWYYPYGETRAISGTVPTTLGFTGQRRDEGVGSLMFYNARYYSPALSRFVSADTIVPEPGNPQALNRYAYVYNAPLKYTDPSGHDVMLVGGLGSNSYDNPAEWEMWVRTYKGWTADEWRRHYEAWMKADATGRAAMMKKTGVYYFNYDMRAASPTNSAMMQALSRQMSGMRDITLIGYSKGASAVLNYLALQEQDGGPDLTRVNKAIVIKAANSRVSQGVAGAWEPGGPFSRPMCNRAAGCDRAYSGGAARLVNIYGPRDWVTGQREMSGAVNFASDDDQNYGIPTYHGNAPGLAGQALSVLDVGGDHNAGLYRLVPWSRR